MRSKEFLTELGNTYFPYEKIEDDEDGVIFYANNDQLRVSFIAVSRRGGIHKSIMEIEFDVSGKYKVTGNSGPEAFKILSTVHQILKTELPKIISIRPLKKIIFSSSKTDLSRTKLYDRAAPIISKILGPGWIFTRSNGPTQTNEPSIYYQWEKK